MSLAIGIARLCLCWALLVALAGIALPARADDPPAVFRVGYFNLPPHAFAGDDATRRNPAIDYFRLIAKKMGLDEIEFRLYPLPRLLKELSQDRIDMILFIARNRERDAQFLYPDRAFFDMQFVLVLPADHKLAEITSADDLLGLRIGVYLDGYHSPMIKDPRLTLEPVTGDDLVRRCYEMMAAGRIDAFFSPDLESARFEARHRAYAGKVKFLPLPEAPIGLYSVFSRNTGADHAARYEKALAEVEKEATYAKFLNTPPAQ